MGMHRSDYLALRDFSVYGTGRPTANQKALMSALLRISGTAFADMSSPELIAVFDSTCRLVELDGGTEDYALLRRELVDPRLHTSSATSRDRIQEWHAVAARSPDLTSPLSTNAAAPDPLVSAKRWSLALVMGLACFMAGAYSMLFVGSDSEAPRRPAGLALEQRQGAILQTPHSPIIEAIPEWPHESHEFQHR